MAINNMLDRPTFIKSMTKLTEVIEFYRVYSKEYVNNLANEIQSEFTENFNKHNTRITALETNIALKLDKSNFESFKASNTTAINNAKSNAISTAATDATNKANKALSDAKAYTDSIRVGGRNYIKDSKSYTHSPNGSDNLDLEFKLYTSAFFNNLKETDKITLSFYVRAKSNLSSTFESNVWFRQSPWNSIGAFSYPAGTTEKKYYSFTINGQTIYGQHKNNGFSPSTLFVRYMKKDTVQMIYENVKIELGGKPTDWTPAPEDVETAISNSQTALQANIDKKSDKGHAHDDRYYTESEIDSKLDTKAVNKTLSNENLNNVIIPGFYNAGGSNTCTNKPSGINAFGLEVIHTALGGYYTQVLYDGDVSDKIFVRHSNAGTWTAWEQTVTNSLTSTSTTSALSANQGKILNEGKLMHKTISTATDFDTLTENGVYHIPIGSCPNAPNTYHGTLFVDTSVGTPYQIFEADAMKDRRFKRTKSSGVWSAWTTQWLTDTTYTALKNPNALKVQFNGTDKVTYDGSSAQTVNITPTAVGTKSSADIDTAISNSVKSTTIINQSTDWNTITEYGTYKVQTAGAWGDASKLHSPNQYSSDLYAFGLCQVIKSGTEAENRTLQIYYPHITSQPVLMRMLNSTGWHNWHPLWQGAASASHNHDSVYSKLGHTHDDRYYTIPEMQLTFGDMLSKPTFIKAMSKLTNVIVHYKDYVQDAIDNVDAKSVNGVTPTWVGSLTTSNYVAAWTNDGKKIQAMSWENARKAANAPKKDGTDATGTWGIGISGNAATSTLATSVKDKTNSTATYLNYGASGLGASGVNWFAAWNNYELRAISPANLRQNISALSSTSANGYEGMGRKDGNTSDWIRTTSNGLIPYQSGGRGSGHSSLGTSSWYFKNAYVDNIYSSDVKAKSLHLECQNGDLGYEFLVNGIGISLVTPTKVEQGNVFALDTMTIRKVEGATAANQEDVSYFGNNLTFSQIDTNLNSNDTLILDGYEGTIKVYKDILPLQAGTIGSGHGSIGSASNYFKNIYVDYVSSKSLKLGALVELTEDKFTIKKNNVVNDVTTTHTLFEIVDTTGEYESSAGNESQFGKRLSLFSGSNTGAMPTFESINLNGATGVIKANRFDGKLQHTGISKMWYEGRDGAILKTTTISGYSPLLSAKTANGSWDLGAYTENTLFLNYITDTNYNAKTNAQTAEIKISSNGDVRTMGTWTSTSANAFRMVFGGYGAILRNDGENTYVLLTDKDDSYGSFNSLRPLYISNANGAIKSKTSLYIPKILVRPNGMGSTTAQVLIGNGNTTNGNMELFGTNPFIDFHLNNSTADYTHRLIEINANDFELQTGGTNNYFSVTAKNSGFAAVGVDNGTRNVNMHVNATGRFVIWDNLNSFEILYNDKGSTRIIFPGGIEAKTSGEAHVGVVSTTNNVGCYLYANGNGNRGIYNSDNKGSLIYMNSAGKTAINGYTSSDRKLKKLINDTKINNALDQILQIKHREFTWIADEEYIDNGYIAQELEEINPNMVFAPDENSSYYSVNMFYMTSLITKGIQELDEKKSDRTEIEELKQQIKELKKQLKKLSA